MNAPNHDEAALLATAKQDESNLARCYLDLKRQLEDLRRAAKLVTY